MAANGAAGIPSKVAVVFNPVSGHARKGSAGERERVIRAVLAAHGVRPLWCETSTDSQGYSLSMRVVASGADLVLVAGGDGTVMGCARALVGTGVPLGIIPSGTGNIIAACLRVPAGMTAATEVALHGDRQLIDICLANSNQAFFAGSLGFSAAVMRDTSRASKARTGMLAYLLSAIRHVRHKPATFELRVDGQPVIARTSDAVLVGNYGQMMTRLRFPQDSLDDGLLEVGILRIRPFLDWPRQVIPVLRSSRPPPIDWYQGQLITIDCDRVMPAERDGNCIGLASRLEVSVMPRSLTVCVPRWEGPRPRMKPVWSWVARDALLMLSPLGAIDGRHKAGPVPCAWRPAGLPARRESG